MFGYLFDIMFVILVIVVGRLVAKRWTMVHCAAAFLSVLFACLIAITTFEPLANWMAAMYLSSTEYFISIHLYYFTCTIVFVGSLTTLLKWIWITLPEAPKFSRRAETIGRWGFGMLTGYMFASFILCLLMTIPAPPKFGGLFDPNVDRRVGPVMACAPDHQFLAFVDYTCGDTFALTGPWIPNRPIIPPISHTGRWGSLPMRYELWREDIYRMLEDGEFPDGYDPHEEEIDYEELDDDSEEDEVSNDVEQQTGNEI